MSKGNKIKLSIADGEYAIYIEIPKDKFNSMDSTVIIEQLKKFLRLLMGEEKENNTETCTMIQIPEKKEEVKQIVTTNNDEFRIRERIPNNVIDIKELDIKQAITEKALVRCPNCGQAHCLAVHSGSKVYVMERSFDKNDFNTIAEFDSLTSKGFIGMCCKPETDKKAYFDDLQSVPVISYDDFALDNNTEVFCPVCCKSDSFLNWKNAYENPLEYFETEHLCDVCGGEVITKMVKKQKVNKCEICGHETKYKED